MTHAFSSSACDFDVFSVQIENLTYLDIRLDYCLAQNTNNQNTTSSQQRTSWSHWQPLDEDLLQGYYQVVMKPEDREKNGFYHAAQDFWVPMSSYGP